ncbi:hypothetical protein OROGR_031542 [Orobanche gracilis]
MTSIIGLCSFQCYRQWLDRTMEKTNKKPLIERARKAAFEALRGEVNQRKVLSEIENCVGNVKPVEVEARRKGFFGEVEIVDYRERLEKELKFTAAGWKRDGHGRWFTDESVSLIRTFC